MIRRTTWILLGIFVLLLGLVWALRNPEFNLGGLEEATPTVQETTALLLDLQPAAVVSLEIQAVGAPAARATATAQAVETLQAALLDTPTATPTIAVTGTLTATLVSTPEPVEYTQVVYEKDANGAWTLLEPQGNLSDAGTVEAALGQLLLTNPIDTLETAPPLEAIGLQPPRYVVKITLEDGSERTVLIGGPTVTGSGFYLQVDGGPITVVNQFSVQAVIDLLENPPLAIPETPSVTAAP
jgi:hypothetical protein